MIFGIWQKATIESWKHTYYLWGKWRSDKNIRVNVRDDLNTSESLQLENIKLEEIIQVNLVKIHEKETEENIMRAV